MGKIYKRPFNLKDMISDWQEPNFSEGALKILKKRYLLKNNKEEIIETPKEMLYRVAKIISQPDKKYKDFNQEESEKDFYNLMAEGKFLPNSPTLKGAGLNINLSACYKIPVEDSREGIFREALYNAICIQAFGGGTGFNFSYLRPKDSLIKSTRGKSSGPISFMRVFDLAIGKVIAQGGTRQGANIGILNYDHKDIEQFITCKKDGGITNFNISVGVTEEFMEKVKNGEEYFLKDHKGKKVKKVHAKEIFDKIVHNAWANGDPGIIFLDRLEKDNPTPKLGIIDGTNPCGEQPLLNFEACNLGSINLLKMIKRNNDGKCEIDYPLLKDTIHKSVHYLDNVIEVNNYPLKKSREEVKGLEAILRKEIKDEKAIRSIIKKFSESPIEKIVKENRKIGLGVMGFADLLIKLGIPYGSEESYKVAEKIMKFIDDESKKASVKLAKTRRKFKNWKDSIYDAKSEHYKGKNLELRNATTTTIAPTGTLSTLAGVEGGIEPLYGVAYYKRAIYKDGKPKIEFVEINKEFEEIAKKKGFYNEKLILEIANKGGSLKNITKPKNISEEEWEQLKQLFVTAHDLSVEAHVKMQNSFQKHVDNAVSKTTNMPKEAEKSWVEKAYWLAYESGIKGITIYRNESKKHQVRSSGESELEGKLYEIKRPPVTGTTIKQLTPHGKAFITLNVLKDNPEIPYETFANIGKGGKDISAISEGYGRLLSLAFKHGVPLLDIIEQLEGIGGETKAGSAGNVIRSLPDSFSKALEVAYNLLNDKLIREKKINNKLEKNSRTDNKEIFEEEVKFSGNFCKCGGMLKPDGGCLVCVDCGFSKCEEGR